MKCALYTFTLCAIVTFANAGHPTCWPFTKEDTEEEFNGDVKEVKDDEIHTEMDCGLKCFDDKDCASFFFKHHACNLVKDSNNTNAATTDY